jgi:vitamin B12 transporter
MQWHFTPEQNVLVGATGRWAEVESLSYGNKYDKSLNTAGYYLQHQYQANGLSTQAGVRVEDNQQFGTHTVGQFGVRYQLLPATSVYANVGSAFKAPTGNDLYGMGGNTQLKSEDSLSYEVGVDQQLLSNLNASLSVYQTKVKNLISFNNQTFTAENIDKAKLTGGEFGLKYTLDNWFANAEYAYVDAQNETTHTQLLRRPHQKGTLTLGWDNSKFGANASLIAQTKAQDWDPAHHVPGNVSANLHAYWQLNQYVKLFTNVQNLGNAKYKTAYDYGNYYIASPRLATAGVTFSY